MFNPYDALTFTPSDIQVDTDLLAKDIHWKPPTTKRAPWKITPIKDYAQARKLYFDIETEGLDPKKHRVIMVGLKIAGDYNSTPEKTRALMQAGHIFEASEPDDDDAERKILARTLRAIEGLKPEIITMHNGVSFDIPFIDTRLKVLGMRSPFYISPKPKFMTAASLNGRGIDYNPVYLARPNWRGYIYNDGSFPQIVDTIHLAGQVDKIRADMESYTLKYLAHYAGGRKEKRLELTNEEIQECWRSRDTTRLREYLIYDLEDQEIVSDFFLPAIWYQQMMIPMPVQELSVSSPARKWNTLLQKFYKPLQNEVLNGRIYTLPESDVKCNYQGASVGCNPGMYRYFFKIDVSSLYPSLILRYGLTDTRKDPLRLAETALETFRDLRYIFKGAAGDDPTKITSSHLFPQVAQMFEGIDLANMTKSDKKKFKAIDGSLKVCINGYYGFLGVGGYPFNSQASAALVTAYGRVLMDEMLKAATLWGNLINLDTDGICMQPKKVDEVDQELFDDVALDQYASHPKTGEFISITDGDFINPEFIWAQVQACLPEGISVDLEENYRDGAMFAPKMKNYVFWADKDSKPKTKGLFRKRNRSKLQKSFPITYAHKWAYDSLEKADEYYQSTVNFLQSAPLNSVLPWCVFTQRIAVSNKSFVEANVGERGQKVTFYWAAAQKYTPTGKLRKVLDRFPVRVRRQDDDSLLVDQQSLPDTVAELYEGINFGWYKKDLDKILNELLEAVNA